MVEDGIVDITVDGAVDIVDITVDGAVDVGDEVVEGPEDGIEDRVAVEANEICAIVEYVEEDAVEYVVEDMV